MTLPTTGPLSILNIYNEKRGRSQSTDEPANDDEHLSLTGLSVDGTVVNPTGNNNARDYIHDGDDRFIDGTPNSSQPFRISEFRGYSQSVPIPFIQNSSQKRSGYTHVATFQRSDFNTDYIGASATNGRYQIVNETFNISGNYYQYWYIEESSSVNAGNVRVNSRNGTMTTGTKYLIHIMAFTQANWPDSYAVTLSNSITGSNASTSQIAGIGEDYSAGSGWSGTVFTLLDPGYGGHSSPSTSFQISNNLAVTNYGTFTGSYTNNFSIQYRKSGYDSITPFTFSVGATVTLIYQEPGGFGDIP